MPARLSFPNLTALMPSANVAVAPPVKVDILTPAITSALSAIKSGVAEYQDAKNYESELDTYSKYYKSKGMPDVADLLEAKKAEFTPRIGSAILGVDTRSLREKMMRGVSALATKELDFKREEKLRSETLRNQILLQDRSFNNSVKLDTINNNQSLNRSALSAELSSADEEVKSINGNIEELSKLGSIPGNAEKIQQLNIKLQEAQKRKANAIKNITAGITPVSAERPETLPSLSPADEDTGSLFPTKPTQETVVENQSSPIVGPAIGSTSRAPGTPDIAGGITLVTPPTAADLPSIPAATGTRAEPNITGTGNTMADARLSAADAANAGAAQTIKEKAARVLNSYIVANDNGRMDQSMVDAARGVVDEINKLSESTNPINTKRALALYNDLDSNFTRDSGASKLQTDSSSRDLLQVSIPNINTDKSGKPTNSPLKLFIRGNSIGVSTEGMNIPEYIPIPANSSAVNLKRAFQNLLVKTSDPEIKKILENDALFNGLESVTFDQIKQWASGKRENNQSDDASSTLDPNSYLNPFAQSQVGSSLSPSTNATLRQATFSSKKVGER